MKARLMAVLVACMAFVESCQRRTAHLGARTFGFDHKLAHDENGILDLGKPLAIVGTILGAVIAILIVASLIGTFFGAVEDVNDNLTNDSVSTGDDTADSIKSVFAIVVGIVAVVALVGVVLAALEFRRRR